MQAHIHEAGLERFLTDVFAKPTAMWDVIQQRVPEPSDIQPMPRRLFLSRYQAIPETRYRAVRRVEHALRTLLKTWFDEPDAKIIMDWYGFGKLHGNHLETIAKNLGCEPAEAQNMHARCLALLRTPEKQQIIRERVTSAVKHQ